ncbi:MAG: thioredoxin fold domain-containing protein [Nitrospirota bacterium]|nr:thioredoxin fold domain-containing protein [Nitrospirota bacterium]
MNTVTYSDEYVIDMISKNFIAVKLHLGEDKEWATRYDVRWTPTFLLLDGKEHEHARNVGYLPVMEMLAFLTLAIGKEAFDGEKFDEAITKFNEVISNYPESELAAEAVYYKGVSGYKKGHDASELSRAYQLLHSKYPNTSWEKKASVWDS